MSVALTARQEREIEAFCQIARENGAAISLRELIELAAIDADEHELATAFDSDSKLRSKYLLESGYVLERLDATEGSPRQKVREEEERRERARANLARASTFGAALRRGTIIVSVSGANSFLAAREHQDIDFFCVTKTNGMWPFMLKALILARVYRLANKDVPELCFSCVMDENWASQAFKSRQPPIFARDALTAKVIGGRSAYHALLKQAPWMGDYFPAFYNVRLRETTPRGSEALRDGAGQRKGSRVLNALLYHTLGRFLRAKSWTLNRKLTRAGWVSAVFETRIGFGHYIYESNRYRKLSKMYGELEDGQAQDFGASI